MTTSEAYVLEYRLYQNILDSSGAPPSQRGFAASVEEVAGILYPLVGEGIGLTLAAFTRVIEARHKATSGQIVFPGRRSGVLFGIVIKALEVEDLTRSAQRLFDTRLADGHCDNFAEREGR